MTDRPTSIRWRGTTDSRAAARELLELDGDVALVVRGGPRWLLIKCPSGCGEVIALNLDRRADKAWHIRGPGPDLSLYPSVWRDVGCESHFVISYGRIWLFGQDRMGSALEPVDADTLERVRGGLTNEMKHFWDVSVALDLETWTVLRACRELVARGEASEVEGYFGRTT